MRLAVHHLCVHPINTRKLRGSQNDNCRMEGLERNSRCGRSCAWTRALGGELVHSCQTTRTYVISRVSCFAPGRRLNFEYILSKRLFHQLDEFSIKPSKGHEFVRIHNVAIRFVHVRIDAKRLRETSVALRYLALIRTVWGKGSPAPS